jgi:hypothetical protein
MTKILRINDFLAEIWIRDFENTKREGSVPAIFIGKRVFLLIAESSRVIKNTTVVDVPKATWKLRGKERPLGV